MYAVIKSGGSQYRVQEGDCLRVERLAAEVGSTIELDQVLLIGEGDQLRIGKPRVEDARVLATVREHGKGTKTHIVKLRRRKHHLKRQGHRQPYTELSIVQIHAGA